MHRKTLLILIMVILVISCLELAARFYVFKLMNDADRKSLIFALNGRCDDIGDKPAIIPYLWSNYRPNPASRQVNEHGWRYGGGERKASVRILCLGGSTTWCQKVSDPAKSYPAQMEFFLREQGCDVEVVNGGCPYYTTAEMIGTLAFRGIYEEVDIVLIHEGGNDAGPFMSNRNYKRDYSHWRTYDINALAVSNLMRFRVIGMLPLYSVRLTAWQLLRPDPFGRQMLGIQLSSARDEVLAVNDITNRKNEGYKTNLRTLVGITEAHGAIPLFTTFNSPKGKSFYLYPAMKDDAALFERVEKRLHFAVDHSNEMMIKVAYEMGVPVIPFHAWNPSKDNCWADQCHLTNEGCKEKAMYIGKWLIEHGYVRK